MRDMLDIVETITITQEKVEKAEEVLMDNGFDLDDAQTVLQAIGFVLLDVDLYYEG